MKRRDFITLFGAAATWPLAARAQQSERVRRVGVLHTPAADDPEGQVRNDTQPAQQLRQLESGTRLRRLLLSSTRFPQSRWPP